MNSSSLFPCLRSTGQVCFRVKARRGLSRGGGGVALECLRRNSQTVAGIDQLANFDIKQFHKFLADLREWFGG